METLQSPLHSSRFFLPAVARRWVSYKTKAKPLYWKAKFRSAEAFSIRVGMSQILKAFMENQTALRRYVRRFALRAEDIEDLVQETFIHAFAAENSRKIRFPKAFLFRVARNLALNERTKMSNATTESLEDLSDQSVIADVRHVSADEEMSSRQHVRLLAQAVASLPPQCSRVFLLRKVQGLTYKQIAERLNISVSTVEKHVALGLLRCSDYLRRQGYDVGKEPAAAHKDCAACELPATVIEMGRMKRAQDE